MKYLKWNFISVAFRRRDKQMNSAVQFTGVSSLYMFVDFPIYVGWQNLWMKVIRNSEKLFCSHWCWETIENDIIHKRQGSLIKTTFIDSKAWYIFILNLKTSFLSLTWQGIILNANFIFWIHVWFERACCCSIMEKKSIFDWQADQG